MIDKGGFISMKKKITALCLFLVMAVTLAVGCSSKDNSTDGTKPEAPTAQPEEKKDEVPAETESKLEYEKIIVGMDDTFAPMGFRDESGNLAGLDIDLANAVSQQLGIPFELQPIDWSMKETELNNKNIDLIWNGYTITPQRQEQVAFTNSYLANKQVVVTMADSTINTLADLAGKTVAAQAESSAVSAIDTKPEIRDSFKELATFETNDQCLMDLEAGRSDAVVADEVLLRYYISQKGEENYKILEEDFGDEEYGIGARKEDTALVEAINTALQQLKESGKTAEISTKWFGADIIK